MKTLTKIGIRIWFTLSCVLTFGLGWIALSRSDVQVETPQTAKVETVTEFDFAPVPSISDLVGNSKPSTSASSVTSPTVQFSRPVIRTKGS